ncbi:MAG: VRR-NUC domain-containing protein [Epulopiscium sp.]|nr:VRR-NUC domain-containing protein [Candidatus Epulonipiscium sp.]
MLENKIERYLKDEIEKINGKTFKFSSPGNNGVPDRIILHQGNTYFVELKKPGEKLRPLQKAVKKRFNKLGFNVYVLDSIDSVNGFIANIGGDQFHD